MHKAKDITGEKYGKLTVLGRDYTKGTKMAYWVCECDCGEIISARGTRLKDGTTNSCGCDKNRYTNYNVSKRTSNLYTRTQLSETRLYKIWQGMKERCYNPKDDKYKYYGAKGIKVCDEWQNAYSFIAWAIENGYIKGFTIDRIDPNKDYSPSNCRWANNFTQSNNRTSNKLLTIDGNTLTIAQWCRVYDIPESTVRNRLNKGMNAKLALTLPSQRPRN